MIFRPIFLGTLLLARAGCVGARIGSDAPAPAVDAQLQTIIGGELVHIEQAIAETDLPATQSALNELRIAYNDNPAGAALVTGKEVPTALVILEHALGAEAVDPSTVREQLDLVRGGLETLEAINELPVRS